MKYSQAVIVACIGGAALVSAAPTRPKGSKTRTPANDNHRNSRVNKIGGNVGSGVQLGSTFALAAGGNPTSANQPLPSEEQPAAEQPKQQTVKSRELPKKKKNRAKNAMSAIQRGGKQAVEKAGGPNAMAEGLGNMYNFANNQASSSSSESTNLRRAVAATTGADAGSGATNSTTPATPETQAPHRQKKKKGGRKQLSAAEKEAKAEKWRNMDPKLKAELKAKHKAHRKGKHSNSQTHSSHNSTTADDGKTTHRGNKKGKHTESQTPLSQNSTSTADNKATTPPTTPPTTSSSKNSSSLTTREVDDIEELLARGLGTFFKDLKGNYKERQRQSQTSQYDSPPLVARDFFDEEELEARDFDDLNELEMRDFEDLSELEARGLWKKVKGIFRGKGKGKSGGSGGVDPTAMLPSSTEPEPSMQRRDLTENEVLVLRDLEDVLDARDLDLNDLEARGVGNAWRALKDTFKGKKPGYDASMDTSTTLPPRDFVDDLEARDIFEEIDELD